MGEVYEAYDRESRETVALKTLLRADASDIYRFKNEFRSLADAAHPNLVSLYELVAEGDEWFFTMELVEGRGFLEYVRAEDHPSPPRSTAASPDYPTRERTRDAPAPPASSTVSGLFPTVRPQSTPGSGAAGADSVEGTLTPGHVVLDRLRPALKQLVEGVEALHEMGKLHRDLKPSNVMVSREGRVVILDFGLITEIAADVSEDDLGLAGTPIYMSPEQAMGLPVTEASDWYSVGVMLYEALVGRPPFTGTNVNVLSSKQKSDPPPPSSLTPDIPRELDVLCRDLLARDPTSRPSGAEILRRLGVSDADQARALALRPAPLVGRARHLAALQEAFLSARAGPPVAVCVHGLSGMGKTALLRHFLQGLRERSRVVVLSGRCYERETVPYKALDGAIDSLTSYLTALPEAEARALIPPGIMALSRLFPVLLRVPAAVKAPHREVAAPDPLVVRRRGFSALLEILRRLSDRQPVVLHIDDLQWADVDSMAFLQDLIGRADAPPLLLLASFRTEEIESKPLLQALLARAATRAGRILTLEALNDQETRQMALSLVSHDAAAESFVETICLEARGSPFLVEQLVRYALAAERQAQAGITLDQMLEARFHLLDRAARPLLETLAVAGRPIEARVACEASGVVVNERLLVGSLRSAQLLRTSGSTDRIEVYHDRIREALTALLSPERMRTIHRRLAQTLEDRKVDDPESILEHYLEAGEGERAARHAVGAAERAASALAFDRAALLYRRALDLSRAEGTPLGALKTELAHALANAGRNPEAAQVYLEVASDAPGPRGLELRRRAAEQLLISGHVDEGLKVMRAGLRAVGLKLARSPGRALLSTLLRRLLLWARGLRYVERTAGEVPESELLCIDTCWAVSVGLALVDVIRAAEFQTRHLLLALRAGEPYRLARALAVEAGFAAIVGQSGRARSRRFSQAAFALAHRVGEPHAIGLATVTEGIAAFCLGRWKEGADLSERAEAILRDQCTGVTWELTSAQSFLLGSLMFRGEVAEVSSRLPSLLAAAREHGNLYASTELRTRSNLVWLAADDPERARREVAEAMHEWTTHGFHRQHYNSLLARAQIALYVGDAVGAWRLVESEWSVLVHSLLPRIQILRLEARHLRARCAVAIAAIESAPERSLRMVERFARGIERERTSWAAPWALLLRAAVAGLRRDEARCARLLADAAGGFAEADMGLYAAVARRRLGAVTSGGRGAQLTADADAWMRDHGIREPRLMTRTLAPGFAGDVVELP